MKSQDGFATLVDDRGGPVRWKVATVFSGAALAVSLVLQIAKAGAKSERLDALTEDVKDLKGQMAVVIRMQAQVQEQGQHIDKMDAKLDKLLERRR